MKRRDILKYAAKITGTAIIAPLTTSMLLGCSEHPKEQSLISESKVLPQFFTQRQFNLVSQIMDTLLPKTDSPSATEVKVNYILDNMLTTIFTPNYQKQFMQKITLIDQHLTAKKFIDAAPVKQEALLLELEQTSDKNSPVYRAYIDLKQQTISYYLSTENIAENFLNYLPIPGGWTPSISVAEVGGKAWAI